MTSSIDDFNSKDFRWMTDATVYDFCEELAAYVHKRYKQFKPLADNRELSAMSKVWVGSCSAYGDVLEEMIRLLRFHLDED